MKKALLYLIFSLLFYVQSHAQNNIRDTSLSDKTIKQVLQGVWGGPDDSFYFMFRGDSVKEWEADGADSSVKHFCPYTLSKTACDSLSAHIAGATGFFITVVCPSIDYDESRCYFIQSINSANLQLGLKGQYDESSHLKKIKAKDGGH